MAHTYGFKPQGCTKDLSILVKESKPTDELIKELLAGFQNCIYDDLFHTFDAKGKCKGLLNKIIALDRAIITAKDGDKYLLKKMQISLIRKSIKLLEEEY